MEKSDSLNPGRKKRVFFSGLVLIAIPLVPFLLLQPYGWTEISFWKEVISPLSHPPFQAMVIVTLMGLDLLLPIPSIPLLLWSGHLFGLVGGTLVNIIGLTLAHTLAYELCRFGGMQAFKKYIGSDISYKTDHFFQRFGSIAIIVSRNLPILSEIISALAGLSGMPRKNFQLAILLSNLPTGILVAYLGSNGDTSLMITGSIALMGFPLLLLVLLKKLT